MTVCINNLTLYTNVAIFCTFTVSICREVRHLLKSCTRFRNRFDFQLISDFKFFDFCDFQAPEINRLRVRFGQNAHAGT